MARGDVGAEPQAPQVYLDLAGALEEAEGTAQVQGAPALTGRLSSSGA